VQEAPAEPYPVAGSACTAARSGRGRCSCSSSTPPTPPTTPPPPTCTRRAPTTRAGRGAGRRPGRGRQGRRRRRRLRLGGRVPGDWLTTGGLAFFPGGTPGAVGARRRAAHPVRPVWLAAHGPAERRRRHRRRPRRRGGHLPRRDGPRGRVRRPPPRRPHRPPLPRRRLPRDHRPRPEHRQRQRLRALHRPGACRTSTATASGELVLTDEFDGAAYVFLGPVSGLLNIGDADLTLEDGGQSWGYHRRRRRPRRRRPPRPRRRRPHLRRRVPRVPGRDLRVPRHRPPRRPGAPVIPGAEAGGACLRVFVPSWSSPSPTVGSLEPR
jgi:hypothetical protein